MKLKALHALSSCADRSVLCEQLCVPLSSDTYECWCWDGHILLDDGIGCVSNESKIDIHFSGALHTYLEKTASSKLLPIRFTGKNFVQFTAPENAYLETIITIEFKHVNDDDGILLYAGEYVGNDFISLAFIGADIIFRFDCGEGIVEEIYKGPFEKHIWHKLNVKRKFCDRSEMNVDNGNSLTDEIHEMIVRCAIECIFRSNLFLDIFITYQ
ncbi:unnamed protein product [Thelazia callipaeda]|uniref:LAM_G_DOMAIN domain-containing protein n=1 Tax=Thelazia callipaeda TaxID=103827 RepID=A0A0N5CNF6_THECL|nr:unnamed protein product [Thelazia callipaeda]